MAYGLVNYPLSQPFRNRLRHDTGVDIEFLLLGELRKLPIAEMLRKLRAVQGDTLFLPIEDDNSQVILPILVMVGALTRARCLIGVDARGRQFLVRRWKAIPAALRLLHASGASYLASLRCRSELKDLARSKRVTVGRGPGKSIAYLRTDLWLGVKVGGSVGHMAGVINSFVQNGFQVEVISLGRHELLDISVVLRILRLPPFGLPFELNFPRIQRAFLSYASRFLTERRPTFLYQRLSLANYAGVILSRMLGLPLVVEYNGSEVWAARYWGHPLRYHKFAVMAEDVMLQHAHLVVTVSEVLRQELLNRGVEPKRVVAYPNCVVPEVFDPDSFPVEESLVLRESLGFEKEDVVVAFVGTFGKWHGAEVLAQAIRHMAEENGEWLDKHRVRFLLVGDGLEMHRVRKILSPIAATRAVCFTGFVPQAQVPSYLAACDIFVSPHVANPDGSRFFGSPTKIFEYMAMGKGIVASDLEQIGEVLRQSLRVADLASIGEPSGHELAVLVSPGDVQELIAGIRFLVEYPEWRHYLGVQARKEVLARYTWNHHVGAIIERLEDLWQEDQ